MEGAHVVPYFLISSMLNPEGKKRRDQKEFGFEIGELDTDYFVGRNVFGDDLERLVGQNVTPDELVEKKDPHTVDNEWCTDCEDWFGAIESHYSNNCQFDSEEGKVSNKSDSHLATLFWCSVMWRIGVTGYAGTPILKSEDLEGLRKLLNVTLPLVRTLDSDNLKKIKEEVEVSIYCHQLLISPEESDIALVVIDPVAYNPVVVVINGRILLFYPKGRTGLTEGVSSLFNTISAIEGSTINPDENEEQEVATCLSKKYSALLTEKIFEVKAGTWAEDTKWLADQLFLKVFGIQIPDDLLHQIKLEVAKGQEKELSIPERYSKERIISIIAHFTHQLLNGYSTH